MDPKRVLIVAYKTAATQALADAVRERAAQGPAAFSLLVPAPISGLQKILDPEDASDDEGRQVLELALPVLEAAAGGPVEGIVGDPNPMNAVQDAINLQGYDEIILSTLPARVSRWLRLDLPSKIAGLGLPVTTVTARERAPSET